MSKASQRSKSRNADRRLTPEEDPEFQIAPMVDILLVLLIFFMSISSTEVLQKNQTVKLPVARDAKAAKKNTSQSIINVTWILGIGGVEVDDKRFPDPNSIVSTLSRGIGVNPEMRVLLRADREVPYEYLRSVLAAVGAAGVSNVTFSVVDKEGAKAQ